MQPRVATALVAPEMWLSTPPLTQSDAAGVQVLPFIGGGHFLQFLE